MLPVPSVHPSVCLSLPFSDSVPFVRCLYARVAVSNAFYRGQHGNLRPRPNSISRGEGISNASPRDTSSSVKRYEFRV